MYFVTNGSSIVLFESRPFTVSAIIYPLIALRCTTYTAEEGSQVRLFTWDTSKLMTMMIRPLQCSPLCTLQAKFCIGFSECCAIPNIGARYMQILYCYLVLSFYLPQSDSFSIMPLLRATHHHPITQKKLAVTSGSITQHYPLDSICNERFRTVRDAT